MPELLDVVKPNSREGRENNNLKPWSSIVGRLVRAIDKNLGNGEVADLRRMRPNDPACPAFWKIMAEYWDMHFNDEEAMLRACLLSGLARTKNLHSFHISLGNALAIAEYSDLRFVRLLRAEGKTLFKEIELMADFLNSKTQPANWTEVAELLFTRELEKTESLKRRIARNYYATKHAKKEK